MENETIDHSESLDKKPASIEHEVESLLRKLQNCQTKQDAKQTEAFHLNLIRSWCALAENNMALSAEQKIEITLLKDTAVSAIKNTVQAFMQSDAYQNLPADPEPLTDAEKDSSEKNEIQCQKAKIKYENFNKGLDKQQAADNGTLFSLDTKG